MQVHSLYSLGYLEQLTWLNISLSHPSHCTNASCLCPGPWGFVRSSEAEPRLTLRWMWFQAVTVERPHSLIPQTVVTHPILSHVTLW